MESAYTLLPDTEPVDEKAERLARFRAALAETRKEKTTEPFHVSAERLEELTRPAAVVSGRD